MIRFKTIGSDPEFGIKKGNEYYPSYLFINGTKKEPEELEKGFFLLKDNLLIEGNIPPASTKNEFVDNMEFLKLIAKTILNVKGAELVEDDLIEYSDRYINTEDGQHFGCSSVDDAYSERINRSPRLRGNNRSLGMHVHVGYEILDDTYDQEELNYYLAKAWDFFATIPSDKIYYSKERRMKYGKYGSFRHTSYGIEFRTLGGFFTRKEYLPWIYDQVLKTIEFVSNKDNCKLLDQVTSADEKYYELLGINIEEQILTLSKVKV